jgi:hypothetical protein
MEAISCRGVAAWLQQGIRSPQWHKPPAIVIDHISSCDHCRGGLFLLLTEMLQLQQPIAAITCNECQNRLATLVDLESVGNLASAARQLPDVWLHLWICADCWETYTTVQHLVAAERQGVLQHVRLNPPTARVQLPLTRITRALLRVVFPAPSAPFSAAGVTRGDTPIDMVLDAQEESDPQFVISVRRSMERIWQVRVSITPPLVGWLLLTLGETQFRARFNAQGMAVVADVPEALLAAVDGPDMSVSVEVEVYS